MDLETRFRKAKMVREHYRDFLDFAHDALEQLGFTLTDMQADIAEYIACGPSYRLVMSQRGEAKSTLACIYGLWQLLMDFNHRVVIVTDGDRQAKENSNLIVGLIKHWDILDFMRPDPAAGDRTSIEAFDLHHALRGAVSIADKSPNLSCLTIFGQLTGARADTLIADDIETAKRAIHAGEREKIYQLSKEFSAICNSGNILFLGTPHHRESLYNKITSEGVDVRIWTGRVPSLKQEAAYGNKLAPYIRKLVQLHGEECRSGYGLLGNRGMPTDPQLRDDEDLLRQEIRWGDAGFDLQYMLDTTLTDLNRQQLRLENLIIADFGGDLYPEVLIHSNSPENKVTTPAGFSCSHSSLYSPILPKGVNWVKPDNDDIVMTLDPSGAGGDEIGWVIGCSVRPYIHILHTGGLTGGLTKENGEHLIEVALEYGVKVIEVESNFGAGLFEITLRGIIETSNIVGADKLQVTGKYVSGNKEQRIIESLATPTQRHRIVVHKSALISDIHYCGRHGTQNANSYSLFHQIENITLAKGSVAHDDRLDALSALVRRFKHVLDKDEEKASRKRQEERGRTFVKNPMGYTHTVDKGDSRGTRERLRRKNSRRGSTSRKRR